MASSFMASLDRNITRVKQETNDKVYKIAIELFLRIVDKSPSPDHPGEYAKGLLANQWYPKAGAGFSEELGTDKTRNGASSRSRINALGGREFFDKNGRLSLTNNVHYAYRAEMLGWPKGEGPPGWTWVNNVLPYRMVALSLSEIAAKYR